MLVERPIPRLKYQFRYLLKTTVHCFLMLLAPIAFAQSGSEELQGPFRLMQLEVPAGEDLRKATGQWWCGRCRDFYPGNSIPWPRFWSRVVPDSRDSWFRIFSDHFHAALAGTA